MSSFSKIFSYSSGRQVWRLLLNNTGIAVLEERSPGKEVFFTILSLAHGTPLVQGLRGPHPEWCGMEAVTDGQLLLHGYARPDMPAHNGMYAYNLADGAPLWQVEHCAFLFELHGDVFASKQQFEGKEYFVFDAADGRLKASLGNDYTAVNAARAVAAGEPGGYAFSSYAAAEESGGIDSRFVPLLREVPAGERVEYLQHNGLFFCAWHRQNPDSSLDQFFTAAKAGSVLYSACINRGIPRRMPDTFFIKDGYLLLLERKDTVTVFRIGN